MPYEHKPWKTDWESPPGGSMRLQMEDRYVTESELAARLGIPYDHVECLLSGASPITPELAPKIGQVLGASAEFWLGLQQDYEDSVRRNNAREAAGINTNVYKMLDAEGRTVKYGMSTDLAEAWDEEELAGNGVYLEMLSWFLHPNVAQRKLDKLQRAFEARKMREREAERMVITAQAA